MLKYSVSSIFNFKVLKYEFHLIMIQNLNSNTWRWTGGSPVGYAEWGTPQFDYSRLYSKKGPWSEPKSEFTREPSSISENKNCGGIAFMLPRTPSRWVTLLCNQSLNAAILCVAGKAEQSKIVKPKYKVGLMYNNLCLWKGDFYIDGRCYSVTHATHTNNFTSHSQSCRAEIGIMVSDSWFDNYINDQFLSLWGKISNSECVLTNSSGGAYIRITDLTVTRNNAQSWILGPRTNPACQQSSLVICETHSITRPTACPPNTYTCGSGECISRLLQCDGVDDCPQGEDEAECEDICTEAGSYGTCQAPDCLCSPAYYQCEKGGCIHLQRVCDGVDDCDSDEKYCTDHMESHSNTEGDIRDSESILCQTEYPTGSRYALWDVCVYDLLPEGTLTPCSNGVHLQECKHYQCPHHFKCPNYYCIGLERVCDGHIDCPTGEDEEGCDGFSCAPGLFKCSWETKCLLPEKVKYIQ